MAANATTKIQVNYGKDGVLVNVYADNQAELEALLTSVQDLSTLINSVNSSVRPTAAVAAPSVATVAAAFNATPVAAAPLEQPGTKTCKHGQMAFKTGTSARGAWQGYMCAAPKGALDKCETIWVR
jgi:hypothetical protein